MSGLPKPKLVIFDLDGTLVDSAADIALAANRTFAGLELPEQSLPQIKQWIGGGAQIFVEKALSFFNQSERFAPAYELFMEHYRAVPADSSNIFDGVESFLEHLYQQQIAMAVVSNKPHELIPPILQHLQIEHYFDRVLGGDSLTLKKPEPEPLLHVCRHHQVDPAECWMVGDSSKDADAAERAKMPFIGVSYGYAMTDIDIRPQQVPHKVVDNLSQLIPLINAEQEVYA
ncbi:phosphoglycolate phosphatase [Kangiella sediminilitoris]|uniref:phosphoglycolate phosphatase n=1 Tax=Kangiella sediminilitoris TaxID=1144748 RepID=A0A1B3B7Q9_9GAMM|nr:phosphoglycolate phosphatase [Kangiella sediminilitoris]AOE48823.1 Phosphoglycolate phosphatase [Kangiella sediminilitoris]